MKLGVYPKLSLADARRRARQVVGEVASDRDPAQARRDARLAPTFNIWPTSASRKYARVKKRSWKEDRCVINNAERLQAGELAETEGDDCAQRLMTRSRWPFWCCLASASNSCRGSKSRSWLKTVLLVSQKCIYTCLVWPTGCKNARFPGRLWAAAALLRGSRTANLF